MKKQKFFHVFESSKNATKWIWMDPNVEKMAFHDLTTDLCMFWIGSWRHDDRSVKTRDPAIQDVKNSQKHEKIQ